MTNKNLLRFCLSLVACAVAGCATGPPPADPHIVIDKSIAKLIAVGVPNIRYTGDGIMELGLQAQNLTGLRLPVQYQVNFFDKDGFEIDTVLSKWNTVVAGEREAFTMQAVAPGQRAQDYRVKLRKGE